jgi:hypothetical protein
MGYKRIDQKSDSTETFLHSGKVNSLVIHNPTNVIKTYSVIITDSNGVSATYFSGLSIDPKATRTIENFFVINGGDQFNVVSGDGAGQLSVAYNVYLDETYTSTKTPVNVVYYKVVDSTNNLSTHNHILELTSGCSMLSPNDKARLFISVGGVLQNVGSYTISNDGKSFTFLEDLPIGVVIEARLVL